MTVMDKINPNTVVSAPGKLSFQCASSCRYMKTSLNTTAGSSFSKYGTLTLRSSLSVTQRGKCRRALRHLAIKNGATTISRDMF